MTNEEMLKFLEGLCKTEDVSKIVLLPYQEDLLRKVYGLESNFPLREATKL